MDFTALQECVREEVLKGVSQGIEEYKRQVQRISEEHVVSKKGGETSPTALPAGSPEAAAHTCVPAVIPGTAANTRNAPTASPSDGIVDALARAITAGFISVRDQQHQGVGGTAGMLRLTKQGLELCVDPWTGVTEREEELQMRFLVFKSTLLAIFAQEGLTDVVIREVPIKVGPTGDDLDSLRESFSADLIKRSTKAWNILISSITHMPILTQILAAGSPSEGWKIFCTYYERRAAREKSRLKIEYYEFRMESNESPQSYFDRFAVCVAGLLA